MKKRILCATLVVSSLIFSGCSQQAVSTETTTTAVISTETVAETTSEKESVSYEFLRYELATDFEGKPAIWIYSRVTNVGNESILASLIAFPTLFQNGVELEIASPKFADTEKAEFQNLSKEIQSGTSIEIAQLYRLQDNSTITVEVSNLINWLAEKEAFVIELQ